MKTDEVPLYQLVGQTSCKEHANHF